MNNFVRSAAFALVHRAEKIGVCGRTVEPFLMDELAFDTGDRIPDWYIQLISTVPICGLKIGLSVPDDPDFAEPVWMEWSDDFCIRCESLECYPGISILEYGFVNCAVDLTGSGNPFFCDFSAGDDPAVYQFLYGIDGNPEKIHERDFRCISRSLSRLFGDCLLR